MPSLTFEKHIAYITARINVTAVDGRVSIGTGFFYKTPLNDGTDRTIIFLLSNKHVFLDPKGRLTVSLNKKIDDDTPDLGNVETFDQVDFESSYYTHPDDQVDLACVSTGVIDEKNIFYKSLNKEFLIEVDYDHVYPGKDVIFVGYPDNRYDVVHNLPLIRKGIIASLPEIDFNDKGQIVIDAQVFPGSSGSPVFVEVKGNYLLLGVISETMIRHSQLQTLPTNMSNIGVHEVLGLGLIIKQRHVIELIEHATIEFIKKINNS